MCSLSVRLPAAWVGRLAMLLVSRTAGRRPPDFVVGATDPAGPYLQRWFITPWRRWGEPDARRWWQRAFAPLWRRLPNLYLHKFLRDDDDRALHDHPSFGVSLILLGHYIEHTIAAGGIHQRREYHAGTLRFMPTRHAHRIELPRSRAPNLETLVPKWNENPTPCWTLFMFGPRVREWGFHCPHRGWVPWADFTAEGRPGEIGPGCDA